MARCAATIVTRPFLRAVSSTARAVAGSSWCARLLSVALFELEDARTPEYAVVDAAVKTAKATDAARAERTHQCGAAPLSARAQSSGRRDRAQARPLATPRRSGWRIGLRADWPVRWTQLLAAGDAQAPMWLRVNAPAHDGGSIWRSSASAGIAARAEPRVPQAVVLDSPCDVHELPGFAEGMVSVQDLGAQCVAFPLELGRGSAGARRLRGARRQDRAHR